MPRKNDNRNVADMIVVDTHAIYRILAWRCRLPLHTLVSLYEYLVVPVIWGNIGDITWTGAAFQLSQKNALQLDKWTLGLNTASAENDTTCFLRLGTDHGHFLASKVIAKIPKFIAIILYIYSANNGAVRVYVAFDYTCMGL